MKAHNTAFMNSFALVLASLVAENESNLTGEVARVDVITRYSRLGTYVEVVGYAGNYDNISILFLDIEPDSEFERKFSIVKKALETDGPSLEDFKI